MIKKFAVLFAVGALAALTSGTALADTIVTGAAQQHPLDRDAAPLGLSGISGRITITDDTTTMNLTIHGTATGLKLSPPTCSPPTPCVFGFFTLLYNTGSVSGAGPPKAPFACDPTPSNTQNIFQMMVGFWDVNPATGTGTLDAVKSGSGNTNLQHHLALLGPLVAFINSMLPPGVPPFTRDTLASAPAYVPLGSFSTISIRPLPQFEPPVACGEVHLTT